MKWNIYFLISWLVGYILTRHESFDVVESLLCSPTKVQVGEVKQMVNKFLCESNLDLQKSMFKMVMKNNAWDALGAIDISILTLKCENWSQIFLVFLETFKIMLKLIEITMI